MNLTDFPTQGIEETRLSVIPRRLGLWTLLLASVFVWAPIVRPGLVQTESGFLPAFNVVANNAIAQVGVTPDLWRGDGIAAFVPAQPLLLLGVAPAVAAQIVMVGSLLLGALAIYAWLQIHMGDRAAGLAGIVYLFLPVTLSVVYRQGSMGGAVALAMIPFALAGIATYARQRTLVAAAVTALAILWLWRTQAGIALVASIVLVLYAFIVEARRGTLLLVLGSAAAGALSLIPIWGIRDGTPSRFVEELGTLYGMLRAAPHAVEVVQIGVIAFALAAVGVWSMLAGSEWRGSLVRRLVIFAAVCAALLYGAGMQWFAPIWGVAGGAWLLVAPWQLAVIGTPFLAATAGSALLGFSGLRVVPYWVATVALVVLAGQPWLQPRITYATPPRSPAAILGNNQIAILSTELKPNDVTGETHLDVRWQVLQPLAKDYNIFVQAMDRRGSDAQKIAQIDAPPLADSPATTWEPGEILSATYTIHVPVGEPADAYWYGWYDWNDGMRLAVGAGIDDKMVLYGE